MSRPPIIPVSKNPCIITFISSTRGSAAPPFGHPRFDSSLARPGQATMFGQVKIVLRIAGLAAVRFLKQSSAPVQPGFSSVGYAGDAALTATTALIYLTMIAS